MITTLLFCAIWPTILAVPGRRIVDMSHDFDESTLNRPVTEKFRMEFTQKGLTKDGYWLQLERYSAGTHAGTHIDAPCHFSKDAWCLDQIPIERFTAPAAIIDITRKARLDRDAQVTIADLRAWEAITGRSLDGHIVIMRSGWGRRWPNRVAYFGTAGTDLAQFHYPGYSIEAARWLVANRKIYGLGSDSASMDPAQPNGATSPVHQTILPANIFGLENVANVDQLPIVGADLVISPMNIRSASGAPVRIYALI